jgi:hypothetical protein
MSAAYAYNVEILHLLVSPGHAYFGRARDGAADVPTEDADRVEVVAGKGIVGDRFFGKAAHMDAAVTLFAVEGLEAMAGELGADPFDPLLTRRNVILRGAQLAPLLGQEFTLESGDSSVRLLGGRPAHPCAWMDRSSFRARMPRCEGEVASAAGPSAAASCIADPPCSSAPSRSSPSAPGKPTCCVHRGCRRYLEEARGSLRVLKAGPAGPLRARRLGRGASAQACG